MRLLGSTDRPPRTDRCWQGRGRALLADPSDARMVESVIERVVTPPILVLITCRPEVSLR